ncbi:MAG: zinc ribbon domain-containing protein [Candidatus Ozemobacteraceae bacterium]
MNTYVEEDTNRSVDQETPSRLPVSIFARNPLFCKPALCAKKSREMPGNSTAFLCIFLVFLCVCSVSFAKICGQCKQEIPDKAKFCASCGHHQSSGSQNKTNPNAKEAIFNLFSPVDVFEKTILKGVFTNIVGGFPEFKSVCTGRIRQFTQAHDRLPEELQILGQMYIEKARAFDAIVTALKNLRLDSTYRAALLRYYGFIVALYDQAIQTLRNPEPFTPEVGKRLKALVKNIEGKIRKHEVTAKYLKIGKTTVNKGTPFAVLEIQKGRAQVLILCETPGDEPLMGWESLSSLRERTTWSTESESFFADSPE